MKKLLFSLLLLPLSANAQLVTNFFIRVQAEVVDTGVSTNMIQTTLNIRPADSAKDKVLSDGLVWFYNVQKSGGETNELSFWAARTYIKDRLKETSDAKNRADTAITLDKLQRLLTTDIDLLTDGDLASLSVIANKAP